MFELEITIHDLPKIMSNGSHGSYWQVVSERKKWAKLVTFAVGNRIPAKPLKKARAEFERHSSMCPDDDNMRISFKYLRDMLRKLGIIEDDRPANLPDPVYVWKKAKAGQGFVKIKITEMEE